MKKTLSYLAVLMCIGTSFYSQTVSLGFTAPATVCVNQTFSIQNTSTGSITSNYWSFCLGSTNSAPTASNLGNVGSSLNSPVYYSIGKENNNYYAFVCNNASGQLIRLSYGISLLNTPTVTNLGNLGILPPSLEDLHLELENGTWYGIAVGGISGEIYRINFGSSLTNTPTAISMGNIGSLSYPQRLQIFWSGGNCYGYTPNRNSNTITQFNFGNSISNVPTGTNLGNIGSLSTCDDMAIINYNGNWYAFVVNEGNNTITRLDFGSSLLNTPTGVNLGNTGALDGPRGIDVFVECGEVRGLVVNRFGNDLLKMTFSGGPTGVLTTTSYGNIGNLSFPHSIERFRVADTLFAMIPNVSNNTLTRIYYPGCQNASVSSSTLQNPGPISYTQTGTYYINYIANEGLISQAALCKQIEVVNTPSITVQSKTICTGNKVNLVVLGATSYSWNTSQTTSTIQVSPTVTTVYTVQGWSSPGCKATATAQVFVNKCTGIENQTSETDWTIFPNPSSGEISLVSTLEDQDLKIRVYDLTGKLVYSRNIFAGDLRTFDISSLKASVYFIEIEDASHSLIRKKLLIE